MSTGEYTYTPEGEEQQISSLSSTAIDAIDLSQITTNKTLSGLNTVWTTSNTAAGGSGTYQPNYGNITINNGINGYTWNNTPTIYTTNHTGTGLHVSTDAEFEGDVKVKGVSIVKTLEDINKRLAILVPDPKKLEHFAALKKAYDHYKTLEALCELPEEENDSN
jgi:hypothetical protein